MFIWYKKYNFELTQNTNIFPGAETLHALEQNPKITINKNEILPEVLYNFIYIYFYFEENAIHILEKDKYWIQTANKNEFSYLPANLPSSKAILSPSKASLQVSLLSWKVNLK